MNLVGFLVGCIAAGVFGGALGDVTHNVALGFAAAIIVWAVLFLLYFASLPETLRRRHFDGK